MGLQKLGDSHEIVSRGQEGEHEADAICSPVPRLAQSRYRLDVAKAFFDPFADTLTDQIAGMTRNTSIDGRLAGLAGLCDVTIAQRQRYRVMMSDPPPSTPHIQLSKLRWTIRVCHLHASSQLLRRNKRDSLPKVARKSLRAVGSLLLNKGGGLFWRSAGPNLWLTLSRELITANNSFPANWAAASHDLW